MITIRLATEKDYEGIFDLNNNAFGYYYPKEKTFERLRYILSRDTDRIWVACDDELIVGYIHGADYECTYSDSVKNVMAIAVDEKYRGQGVGRQLLGTLEKWADENGCAGVRLVSGFNREKAHQFYYHCGYNCRKDQKNFVKLF